MKAVSVIALFALLAGIVNHHGTAGFRQSAKIDRLQPPTEIVSQWGGPSRNFRYPATELSDTWNTSGPQVLWQRDLGGGYAGISVGSGRVFTTIRESEQELDIALDAETGNRHDAAARCIILLRERICGLIQGRHFREAKV